MSRLVDSTASGITSWRIVWFALVLLLNYMPYQFIKCEIGITYYFLLVVFQSHIVGVKYPGYRKSPVTAQNSTYDRFPPAANGWGTIHLVPDKAPPL
jgi:hypothetical protein